MRIERSLTPRRQAKGKLDAQVKVSLAHINSPRPRTAARLTAACFYLCRFCSSAQVLHSCRAGNRPRTADTPIHRRQRKVYRPQADAPHPQGKLDTLRNRVVSTDRIQQPRIRYPCCSRGNGSIRTSAGRTESGPSLSEHPSEHTNHLTWLTTA